MIDKLLHGNGLKIERDLDLVLRAPQHFHVVVFNYRSALESGQMAWSTRFELVANDLQLAVSRAKKMGSEPNVHIGDVRQCADPAHLEGLEDLEGKG